MESVYLYTYPPFEAACPWCPRIEKFDLIQLAERMELLQCIARVQVYTFLYIVVTPENIDQRR